MNSWIAISRTNHAQARYRPRQGFHHTAQQQLAPVLVSEVHRLLPHYVLAFIKSDTNFVPVALLGLGDGPNLYLNADGNWLGNYVPATFRGYPFNLAYDSRDERILSIDEQHLVLDGNEGEPLLTAAGELTDEVKRHAVFLQNCIQDQARTRQAVDALAAAGLIVPWALKVKLAVDAEPEVIEGLYGIEEQRLDTLSSKRYASLQGPAMTLAYAQRFSKSNLEQISRRAIYHVSLMEAQAETSAVPEDLGRLFGDLNDDLVFDFDK